MMNIDYVSGCMTQGQQLLSDVFHLGGVMKVFKDYSVGPLFLYLVCVKVYSIFFEVFDKGAVCVWSRTG